MNIYISLFVVSFIFLFSFSSCMDDHDFFDNPEVAIRLSHSFGLERKEEEMIPRGSILIRSFKGPKFTSEQKDLTLNDLNTLQDLQNKDGYYFLKLSVKLSNGEKTFKSFVPARNLLESGLSDMFIIHLNPSGEIYAISYAMSRNDFFTVPHVLGSGRPPPQRFNTTVLVHHGEPGPLPDTAPYLEKLEMERMSKERGDNTQDNRSFLAKYWMYIIPIALLVLLSGASNPEEGGR